MSRIYVNNTCKTRVTSLKLYFMSRIYVNNTCKTRVTSLKFFVDNKMSCVNRPYCLVIKLSSCLVV